MGLFAEIAYGPSPSFQAVGATTGALAAGTYTYVVAYNTTGGIAGLSAQVAVQTSGAGGVGITIAHAFVPATATGYMVYRTKNGGGSFFQITGAPFTLASAGTQFVDSTSDATLGGNPALPATVISGGLISTQRLAELTNPDAPQNSAAGPNYGALQSAVWQAQAFFYGETGVPYDDTTPSGPPVAVPTNQPSTSFPPPGGNVCHWCGVGIVIALLYDYRAHPWPGAEVEAAWREARARLARWRTQFGSVRWAAPGTDSNYTPSRPTGPYPILPDFDTTRTTRALPDDPQPFTGGGSQTSGWGPGGF